MGIRYKKPIQLFSKRNMKIVSSFLERRSEIHDHSKRRLVLNNRTYSSLAL